MVGDANLFSAWAAPAACILMLLGTALFLCSLGLEGRALSEKRERDKILGFVRGFRIGIVGLCLVGAGAGWLWDIHSLFMLSLIIGGEELLESSVIVAALKNQPEPSCW